MYLSLPQVRKQANVCRWTIKIKETQKHEKTLDYSRVFLCVPYCETKMARPKGFCLGTTVPIASLALVAAAKKQSAGLFFHALFKSLRFG